MAPRLSWLLPLALVGALALAIAASACGGDDDDGTGNGAQSEVQLTGDDNGKTVTIAKDGTLIVALVSNPSTGFSWAVIAAEPANLELQGEPKYLPAGSTTPVAGAAGTEVFTFKAVKTGTSKLSMGYARSWEQGAQPEQTFEITVVVE
ncbi:MAG TPA: protease inhibitor I42 family protein [Tepidiformaceae bacterium]|nr:protease inhibitor I42 family protein [Tepidiformaceae bacterium]